MKKLFSLLLALSMLLSFTSCNSDSKKAYSVAYDILAEPKNLDPQTASDQASLIVINNIFEGLFSIDETGKIQNGLAKSSVKSANGLELTIEIIDNATWTNGEEITADDFVFAFQRILMPETRSPAATQFYSIKNARAINEGEMGEKSLGVRALDKKKLVFELEYQNDNLENLLATTYAMPCNKSFFESTKGKYGLQGDKIMSNGAFDISLWSHKKYITLKKSVTYHDVISVLPTFITLNIEKSGTPVERLLKKNIDAALIKGNEVEAVTKKGYNTEAIESDTWGICLNTKSKYLSNKNIRNAISSCFDTESYKEKLEKNLSVATGIIPHSIMLFDKSFREYSGEIITKGFSSKLGYEFYLQGLSELSQSNISALTLIVNKDSGIKSAEYFSHPSQILQKELSLFINIDELEESEYTSRLASGDFDMAIYKLTSGDNTVNSILSRFKSDSNQNITGYTSEEYDALLTGANSKTNKLEIINDFAEAEKKLIEDAVFIPMYFSTDYFVTAGTTTGITRNKRTGLISFKYAVIK